MSHQTEKASGVRILGISGSSRKRSYNLALLRASLQLLPKSTSLEILEGPVLPIFNQDLEHDLPVPVQEMKRRIKEYDAILFSVPEHNYSITAQLKNILEWGARPPGQNSWSGKPAGMMSASTSARGGVRAQLHLRHIMVDLNMYTINTPQLLMGNAETKFDDSLRLTDEQSRNILRNLLLALADWTRKLRGY